jgi:hypothetical protein
MEWIKIMPKDNNLPDRIILGKDLKEGDILREKKGLNDTCIITEINYKDKEERDHLSVYDINSEEYLFTFFNPNEEYIVICNREEILKYYDLAELQLLRASADAIKDRNELINIRRKCIKRLNDNLFK